MKCRGLGMTNIEIGAGRLDGTVGNVYSEKGFGEN